MTLNQNNIKRVYSPLIYPGGKGKVARELAAFALANNPKSFAVPFGGGSAVLLTVAAADPTITLHYNDMDARLAALFTVVSDANPRRYNELVTLVRGTTPSLELFDAVGPTHVSPSPKGFARRGKVTLAYAGLVRNRLAFSGIMNANAGARGGRAQTGSGDRIGARWNTATILKRLARMRELLVGRTTVTCGDFADVPYADAMVIDPPYVRKADKLYAHWFTFADHVRLARYVKANPKHWIVTYDNDPLVAQLYHTHDQEQHDMTYSITQGGATHVKLTELWVRSDV